MTTEELEDKLNQCHELIEEFSVHYFGKFADTFGGQAFRKWVMLYRKGPVFIGFNDDRKPIVLVSSLPEAEWKRGCQDSCAYCDIYPIQIDHKTNRKMNPPTAKLQSITTYPEEIQEKAIPFVLEAIKEVDKRINNGIEQETKRKEAEHLLRQKQDEIIVEAWRNY